MSKKNVFNDGVMGNAKEKENTDEVNIPAGKKKPQKTAK